MKTTIIAIITVFSSVNMNITQVSETEMKPSKLLSLGSLIDDCKDLIVYSVPSTKDKESEQHLTAYCCKKLIVYGNRTDGKEAIEYNA